MTSLYIDCEQKGFNLEKINAPIKEWDIVLACWTKKRLLAAMGWVNKVIYKLAVEFGALVKEREHFHTIRQQRLKRLITMSRHKLCELKIFTKGFDCFLLSHWRGAILSDKSIRSIRNDLAALGLFKLEKPVIEPGSKGTTKPPVLVEINLEFLLLFYERLEEWYLHNNDEGWDKLPKHRGCNIVRLFNAVFRGLLIFRRQAVQESELPEKKPKTPRVSTEILAFCSRYLANVSQDNQLGVLCLLLGAQVVGICPITLTLLPDANGALPDLMDDW